MISLLDVIYITLKPYEVGIIIFIIPITNKKFKKERKKN